MLEALPLEVYAHIVAALGEGYPLDAVLEREGLSADEWEAAEAGWVDRLAESDEAEGDLFDALDRAVAAARARFDRGIEPLDDDLDAWLAFQGRVSSAQRPLAELAAHGLFLGDWVRLQERWATRLAGDPEIRARAGKLLAGPLGPLPEVRPAARALPPPLLDRGPRAPREEPVAPPAEDVPWGLVALRGPGEPGASPALAQDRPSEPDRAPVAPLSVAVAVDQTLPPATLEPAIPLPFRPPVEPRDRDSTVAALLAQGSDPVLTLAEYASLCAELAALPGAEEAIFQRRGLSSAGVRARVDAAWKEELQRDPAAYAEWQALYRSYHAHWTGMLRSGPGERLR